MSFLQFIYVPFSYVMKGCLWIAQNNYFFALFFFALAFQIILFPLAIKQQKTQVKQAMIKPKEMAIRKKYAGRTDRVTQQKMNQEIQEMYQAQGFNPLSGCLPLLIQLPLILILYAIVRSPIQYSSNFSDAAKDSIREQLEVGEVVVGSETPVQETLERLLINYVEDIRSNLTKTDAGKEANEELIKKLNGLRTEAVKQKDDAGNEIDAVYDNAYVKYQYKADKSAGYTELTCSDILANYGDEYIQELKESGALGAYTPAIRLSYEENGKTVKYAEMIPNFTFLSINLLHTPSFTGNESWRDWILLLIPVLVFATSFLNTLIVRHFTPTMNQNQQGPFGGIIMRVGLPLMSAAFTLMFPAAIGVYWIWRTLIDMVKPLILSKMYPMPKFTEEDYAAAERELKGKPKKKKVITIEVDEDDDSYADLEVSPDKVSGAKPKDMKTGGSKGTKEKEELPYRRPSKIEMLSAEDEPDAGNGPADNSPENPSSDGNPGNN